ncbi:S8 family serine peptidase [Deinococcus deserti]|uniref:Putative Peptidase-S8, Subtilase family n=1 Tax=Deinococcus deserti (strain DSM 17065 / CIP 109153 / LMG 22923 / VCD115) TaxID=546414 RepID=C1CZV0_DEIDV|nr:S8 family serine peptidase [Deinococcus deserti]ACO45202.1 putative Peptidase-S8, Subtilase family [Deinococcus deserti VCD115]
MRVPVFSFLLPALLLASCGSSPRDAASVTPSSPARLLTVNVTSAQSDAELVARYGGQVVLRTTTFAVIGDPQATLSPQTALVSGVEPNRGVLQAAGAVGLWGNGAVGLWGNGAVGLWGNGAVGLWANGAVGLWGNGAENFWTDGQYTALPANTEAWKSIELEGAYRNVQRLGKDITIAVIDTGVDVDHPMFQGRLSDSSTWKDFVDGDDLPQEVGTAGEGEFGHGTVIAGIAAQIAPNARLMPLRVLNPEGGGDVLNVAAAIVWAADRGADVINLSLGTSESVHAIQAAIEYANVKGIVVAAAAGNSGQSSLDYPASSFGDSSLNISVGSVNNSWNHSTFSSYGKRLQLNAPGEIIVGPFPGQRAAQWTGTSMSTPVVAGALALGLGEGRTPREAVGALRATAVSIDSVDGNKAYAGQLGRGRLDLDAYTSSQ